MADMTNPANQCLGFFYGCQCGACLANHSVMKHAQQNATGESARATPLSPESGGAPSVASFDAELAQFASDLASRQKPLDPEFAAIFNENARDLYISDPAPQQAGQTPRTDEKHGCYFGDEKMVPADFARTLERELQSAQAALARREQSIDAIAQAHNQQMQRTEAAEAERNEYWEALQLLTTGTANLELGQEEGNSHAVVRNVLAGISALQSRLGEVERDAEYEFEVWQSDWVQASGCCSTEEAARTEANHYAAQFGQDGPVEVKLYRCVLLDAALSKESGS